MIIRFLPVAWPASHHPWVPVWEMVWGAPKKIVVSCDNSSQRRSSQKQTQDDLHHMRDVYCVLFLHPIWREVQDVAIWQNVMREREGEEDEACYWMDGGWWTQRLREIRIKPFLRKHDFQKLKFEGIFWISSKSGFILRCTVIWGKISVVWRPWPTKKQGILIQISSPVKPPCF